MIEMLKQLVVQSLQYFITKKIDKALSKDEDNKDEKTR